MAIRYVNGIKTVINEFFNPNHVFDDDDRAALEKEEWKHREHLEMKSDFSERHSEHDEDLS